MIHTMHAVVYLLMEIESGEEVKYFTCKTLAAPILDRPFPDWNFSIGLVARS